MDEGFKLDKALQFHTKCYLWLILVQWIGSHAFACDSIFHNAEYSIATVNTWGKSCYTGKKAGGIECL